MEQIRYAEKKSLGIISNLQNYKETCCHCSHHSVEQVIGTGAGDCMQLTEFP